MYGHYVCKDIEYLVFSLKIHHYQLFIWLCAPEIPVSKSYSHSLRLAADMQ